MDSFQIAQLKVALEQWKVDTLKAVDSIRQAIDILIVEESIAGIVAYEQVRRELIATNGKSIFEFFGSWTAEEDSVNVPK